jgi:hypothetical protein
MIPYGPIGRAAADAMTNSGRPRLPGGGGGGRRMRGFISFVAFLAIVLRIMSLALEATAFTHLGLAEWARSDSLVLI